jgi:N-acetylmuramoyl-L-alanine amidase
MIRRDQGEQGRAQRLIAWFGVLLMTGSFVWIQVTAVPQSARVDPETPAQPMPFALVVIDPGHGGQDPGTTKTGMVEKELTLDLAYRLQRQLQERGLAALLTRTDDSYVSLQDRTAIANDQQACIFVSIHFDEAGRPAATGIETFYAAHPITLPERVASWLPFLQRTSSEPPNVESQSLATFIQESLVAHTQAVDRGTRPQQFYVIANVRHPAVLVEGGFLTNKDDVAKLANNDYREQMATAISEGIVQYRNTLQEQRTPLAVDLPGD